MKPTPAQREILTVLAGGGRLAYAEGEGSTLGLLKADGDWVRRVDGGMRWRLTRNGWLRRYRLTDAGRAALAQGEGSR